MTEFTEAELAYLKSQRLGRLATVDPQGQPQANPVGFFPQADGTILIGGYAMGSTKKWRNLRQNPKVALVVDDIVSLKPWRVRGIDIRGEAELLTGPHQLGPHMSEEVIRIHPRRIHSWVWRTEGSGVSHAVRQHLVESPHPRRALQGQQPDLPVEAARIACQ